MDYLKNHNNKFVNVCNCDLYKSISLSFEQEMPTCVKPSSVMFRQIPNFMLESCEHLEMDFRPAVITYVESASLGKPVFHLIHISFREAE